MNPIENLGRRPPIQVDLRLWAEGDLSLLERLMGDPAMMVHLGGPETPEKIRERHARYCADSQAGDGPMFVILAGPERAPAGSIGYWPREWQAEPVWESGWSVLPEFQGRGIATQALRLIVARARDTGAYRMLHAFPSVDNAPSNAVCRKAGFILQGAYDFEYPKGHPLRCNDWRLDLFAGFSRYLPTVNGVG